MGPDVVRESWHAGSRNVSSHSCHRESLANSRWTETWIIHLGSTDAAKLKHGRWQHRLAILVGVYPDGHAIDICDGDGGADDPPRCAVCPAPDFVGDPLRRLKLEAQKGNDSAEFRRKRGGIIGRAGASWLRHADFGSTCSRRRCDRDRAFD